MSISQIKYPSLINGISYSWSNIQIVLLGKPVVSVSSIKYERKVDTQMVYGSGSNPTARAFGNVTCEGSITLRKEELVQLQNLMPDITDIPDFTIQVHYLASPTQIHTDTLKQCVFTNNGVSVSQNDPLMEMELTLSIGAIEFGQTVI